MVLNVDRELLIQVLIISAYQCEHLFTYQRHA